MNTSVLPASTVKLNIPAGILQHATVEAHRIGISLQDFIRMLLATYFAHTPSIRAISRDQAFFDRSVVEIQRGEYTKIQSKNALDGYLDNLDR